jgi:predicted small lipoprotein YifL
MKRLLLAAAVFVLAGCGSSTPSAEWNGPPRAKPNGTLEVAEFNDFLAKGGEDFAHSPIAAVAEFLGLGQSTAAHTKVESTSPGEVRDVAEVVATLQGLLDDSVRDARYTVELMQDESGMWRLRAADWAQRCQSGRGHQDFSAKPCV